MSHTTRNPASRRAEWRSVQYSINPLTISLFGAEEAKLYSEMTAIEADLGPANEAHALAAANLRAHDDATARANRMGEIPPPKADRDHLEHAGHQAAAALRVVQDKLRRARQHVVDAFIANHEDRASRAVPRVAALHEEVVRAKAAYEAAVANRDACYNASLAAMGDPAYRAYLQSMHWTAFPHSGTRASQMTESMGHQVTRFPIDAFTEAGLAVAQRRKDAHAAAIAADNKAEQDRLDRSQREHDRELESIAKAAAERDGVKPSTRRAAK